MFKPEFNYTHNIVRNLMDSVDDSTDDLSILVENSKSLFRIINSSAGEEEVFSKSRMIV